MDRLLSRETDMDKSTFNDIRDSQQNDKYRALNKYKIKLCSTHADNYIDADASQNPDTQSGDKGENNPSGGLRWNLPAIPGNHIQNALVRVVGCHLPASVFNYTALDTHNGKFQIDFSGGKKRFDLLYIKSSNVINKTYVSNSDNLVFPYQALGSINIQSLYKAHHSGLASKDPEVMLITPAGNETMIDSDFILCNNPFGSTINLELIEPNSLANVPISSCKSGEEDAKVGADGSGSNNSIIDNPIVWELEVILLPDNQSNDKFSY